MNKTGQIERTSKINSGTIVGVINRLTFSMKNGFIRRIGKKKDIIVALRLTQSIEQN